MHCEKVKVSSQMKYKKLFLYKNHKMFRVCSQKPGLHRAAPSLIGYLLRASDKEQRLNFEGHEPQFPVPKALNRASAPDAEGSTLDTFHSGCAGPWTRRFLAVHSSPRSLNLRLMLGESWPSQLQRCLQIVIRSELASLTHGQTSKQTQI